MIVTRFAWIAQRFLITESMIRRFIPGGQEREQAQGLTHPRIDEQDTPLSWRNGVRGQLDLALAHTVNAGLTCCFLECEQRGRLPT